MKWPWTHFRHIPKWYPAAFERLPDVLACELTVTGWTGRIDWAQMDYVARSLSLEELAESIKRWGESNPKVAALLRHIQSDRTAPPRRRARVPSRRENSSEGVRPPKR